MAINEFVGKYKFLSNFCKCEVNYEDTIYPTTEHAFQAAKTYDLEERHMILSLKKPLQAKRKGLTVKLRADWEEVKNDIMKEILRKKFEQPQFKQLLLETQDEDIIEGNNWHDNYWGMCTCENCGSNGQNVLGELIKSIRSELRSSN